MPFAPFGTAASLLEKIVSSTADGIAAYDFEGRYILWNKGMERLTGKLRDEVLGKVSWDVFPFLKVAGIDKNIRRAISDGETSQVQNARFVLDGSTRGGYFDATYSPLYNPDGEVIGCLAVVHDITARYRAERALAESELKFRSLTQFAMDAIVMCDSEGKILFWNQAAEEIFQYRQSEIIGKSISRIIPEAFWAQYVKEVGTSLNRDAMAKYGRSSEVHGVRRLGSGFPMDITLSAWNAGGRLFFSALIRDISDRLHLEALVEEREDIHEALLRAQSALGEGVSITSFETGKLLYANEALGKLHGYTQEELLAMPNTWGLIAPNQHELLRRRQQLRVRDGLQRDHFETVGVRKDGSHFHMEVATTVEETRDGTTAISLSRDITKRKQAELELAGSRRINAQIVKHAHDVICTASLDGTVTSVNPSFERASGWKAEEWIGKNIFSFVHSEDLPNVQTQMVDVVDGKSFTAIARCLKFDGTHALVEGTFSAIIEGGRVVGIMVIARDISERVAWEKTLLEEQIKFRAMTEASFDAVAVTENGLILEVNDKFCNLFGYTRDEVIGMTTDQFSTPEGASETRQRIANRIEDLWRGFGKRKDESLFRGEVRAKNFEYRGRNLRVAAIREFVDPTLGKP